METNKAIKTEEHTEGGKEPFRQLIPKQKSLFLLEKVVNSACLKIK